MDVIERIFALVDQQYKEQQDFALALGVSVQMVSAWRTGALKSYTKRLPQIAEVLGTTVQWLVTGEELPPKSETPTPASGEVSAEQQALLQAYEQADEKSRALVRLALGLE